jgi:hypothetical protein
MKKYDPVMLFAYLSVEILLNLWYSRTLAWCFDLTAIEAVGMSLNTPFNLIWEPDGLEYIAGTLIPGAVITLLVWNILAYYFFRRTAYSRKVGISILIILSIWSTLGFLRILP